MQLRKVGVLSLTELLLLALWVPLYEALEIKDRLARGYVRTARCKRAGV